jgi:hypothetical protein
MGQYHILVNLDKHEWVSPHGLGLGAKQYEHTACEGSLSDAMYLLSMSSPANGGGDLRMVEGINGRWCGDRIVIVGDYTQEIPGYERDGSNLYELAMATFVNLTDDVRRAFEVIYDLAYEEKSYGSFTSWHRTFGD